MSRVQLRRFRRAAALACGLGLAIAALRGQEDGAPTLNAYTWRDYRAHHQVWKAVEDDRGLMLFGNLGVLLEYDGNTWRKIPIPRATFLRGVVRGPGGRIYVGGSGQLGWLDRDPLGQWQFVSLLDRLAPEQRDFGTIWDCVANRDAVYFETGKRLLRWSGGQFRVWETPPGGDLPAPYRVFETNGAIYIQRRDDAVWRAEGDRWIELTPQREFRMSSACRAIGAA